MVSAGIPAAVVATSAPIGAATATGVATATAAPMASTMLGDSELRNGNDCRRSDAGEKYLQKGAFPHIDNPLPNCAGLA
jgi:hypothetical protein